MPDELYDTDILLWSEQQADLLRRAATGERVNGLDWVNLIDEVESVGKSQLQSCESLLAQALRHLLKAAAWPESLAVRHWRIETKAFLTDARRRFTPSMRSRIDLADLYAEALEIVRLDEVEGRDAGPLPETCPLTLDQLLARSVDVVELGSQLRAILTPLS